MNWRYTNIQHGPRLDIGVTPNEYCVLDLYYQSQASPVHSVDGWSENTYKEVGEFLGFSKGAVHAMVDRFVSMGLMEVNPANTKQKKTTEKWYLVAYERVQKLNADGDSRSKIERPRSKSERNRSNIERHIDKREVKDNLKEREQPHFPSELKNSTNENGLAGRELSKYDTEVMNDFISDNPEAAVQNILARVRQYHIDYPGTGKRVCEMAKNMLLSDQYQALVLKWVRHYAENREFYKYPTRRLFRGRGNLVGWVAREAPKAEPNRRTDTIEIKGYDSPIMREKRERAQRAIAAASKAVA